MRAKGNNYSNNKQPIIANIMVIELESYRYNKCLKQQKYNKNKQDYKIK